MAEVRIIPATADHALYLSETMREEDRQELAACGQSPGEGLLACLAAPGEAWTVLVDGQVLFMTGVTSDTHIVWVLTSTLVDRKAKTFWRVTKEIRKGFLSRYGTVENLVDSRYERALRWAIRLGGKYEGELMIGGVLFYRMVCRGE